MGPVGEGVLEEDVGLQQQDDLKKRPTIRNSSNKAHAVYDNRDSIKSRSAPLKGSRKISANPAR